MRKPVYQEDWPESWRNSYRNDAAEFWGPPTNVGYRDSYQRRLALTLALIERHLPAGSTIVDVAAAKGTFTLELAERGYRVTWNDLRGELAGYVQLKYETGDVEYLPGNIFDIPEAGPFDAVLAAEVIEHVAHPDEFLAQIRQLCRPGGLVILTTPNGRYFRSQLPTYDQVLDFSALEEHQFQPGSDGHLFLFTNDELKAVTRAAGFEPIEVVNFNTPMQNGDLGRLARGHRFIPAPVRTSSNTVLERLAPKLCFNTALVLRRPPE